MGSLVRIHMYVKLGEYMYNYHFELQCVYGLRLST